jgi:hypothetical protein
MAYSVKNVIVGAAALYISKADSTQEEFWDAAVEGRTAVALPTMAPGTTAAAAFDGAGTDWRHVGLTQDGVEVAYEPDFGTVDTDQLLDAAKMFKQGQSVSVNTTLAEATLENLLVVWGMQNDALGTDSGTEQTLSIAGGALGDEPVERSIAFVGPAPRSPAGGGTGNKKRERVYFVHRALQVESSSHSLAKAANTAFPVSFRILPDPTWTGSEYGIIRDRNVEA